MNIKSYGLIFVVFMGTNIPLLNYIYSEYFLYYNGLRVKKLNHIK